MKLVNKRDSFTKNKFPGYWSIRKCEKLFFVISVFSFDLY